MVVGADRHRASSFGSPDCFRGNLGLGALHLHTLLDIRQPQKPRRDETIAENLCQGHLRISFRTRSTFFTKIIYSISVSAAVFFEESSKRKR